MSRVVEYDLVRVAPAGSLVPDDDVLHPTAWSRYAAEREPRARLSEAAHGRFGRLQDEINVLILRLQVAGGA